MGWNINRREGGEEAIISPKTNYPFLFALALLSSQFFITVQGLISSDIWVYFGGQSRFFHCVKNQFQNDTLSFLNNTSLSKGQKKIVTSLPYIYFSVWVSWIQINTFYERDNLNKRKATKISYFSKLGQLGLFEFFGADSNLGLLFLKMNFWFMHYASSTLSKIVIGKT